MTRVQPMQADNVDYSEIKKFEALAERWWDTNSEFKPLHDTNPLRLEFIEQHCHGLYGKQVLDIGCGGGILSDAMSRKGATVTAIDMGEAPLAVARLHQLESKQTVNYIKTTAEQLAEEQGQSFDVITCLEMLEHVPDPSSIIAACKTLVKPDGDIFFSTINRNLKSYCFAIIGAEYILNLLPKGTHDYAKFIKPSELDTWSRQSGLQLNTVTGLHYNPMTKKYWLSDQNIDVNYFCHYRVKENH